MDGFDIDQIDEVIHGRLRLGIMAHLANVETAEFNELKQRLSCTDGNLSAHLRKLEEAGYVRPEKSFVGRKPMTRVRLTREGRAAFVRYLATLSLLVEAAGGSPP